MRPRSRHKLVVSSLLPPQRICGANPACSMQIRKKHGRELFVGRTSDGVLDCEISGQAMLRTVLISVLISTLGRRIHFFERGPVHTVGKHVCVFVYFPPVCQGVAR